MAKRRRGPVRMVEPGEATAEGDCPGTVTAFGRKAGYDGSRHDRGDARSWGRCWKCNRPLGCAICTTSNALEVLCRPCAAWGTFDAFEHHGPIVGRGPAFAQYPEEWRRKYTPIAEEFPWFDGEANFASVRATLTRLGLRGLVKDLEHVKDAEP